MLGHGLHGEFEIYFKLSMQSGDPVRGRAKLKLQKSQTLDGCAVEQNNVSGIQVSALET